MTSGSYSQSCPDTGKLLFLFPEFESQYQSNMNPRLRPDSNFVPFTLPLANHAVVTGIAHIPQRTTPLTPRLCPLVVGIHGGSCTAHHFDIDNEHTASLASLATGIPFVAFNRPWYAGSTKFDLSDEESFFEVSAYWMHHYIFPELWAHFGQPNGYTAMVTSSHSMATPQSIIAAALYASDDAPKYPLAGIILSGTGTRPRLHPELQLPWHGSSTDHIVYSPAVKQMLMLSEAHLKCHVAGIETRLAEQSVPMPRAEVIALRGRWVRHRSNYAAKVRVPVMYAVGEHDWLISGTREAAEEFGALFKSCHFFTGGTVPKAPHALEWSHASNGWYLRCFAWAIEVCSLSAKEKGHPRSLI